MAGAMACSHGRLEQGLFTKSETSYRIGDVPQGWKLISFRGNDLAFQPDDATHLIAVNSTCRDYEDAPLPVLTRQLLMGFTERKLIKQETRVLDSREALSSHYEAKMDGVPIELLLVVMKKNGCAFDFTYLSPPERFEEKRASFEALLNSFTTEVRR